MYPDRPRGRVIHSLVTKLKHDDVIVGMNANVSLQPLRTKPRSQSPLFTVAICTCVHLTPLLSTGEPTTDQWYHPRLTSGLIICRICTIYMCILHGESLEVWMHGADNALIFSQQLTDRLFYSPSCHDSATKAMGIPTRINPQHRNQ